MILDVLVPWEGGDDTAKICDLVSGAQRMVDSRAALEDAVVERTWKPQCWYILHIYIYVYSLWVMCFPMAMGCLWETHIVGYRIYRVGVKNHPCAHPEIARIGYSYPQLLWQEVLTHSQSPKVYVCCLISNIQTVCAVCARTGESKIVLSGHESLVALWVGAPWSQDLPRNGRYQHGGIVVICGDIWLEIIEYYWNIIGILEEYWWITLRKSNMASWEISLFSGHQWKIHRTLLVDFPWFSNAMLDC